MEKSLDTIKPYSRKLDAAKIFHATKLGALILRSFSLAKYGKVLLVVQKNLLATYNNLPTTSCEIVEVLVCICNLITFVNFSVFNNVYNRQYKVRYTAKQPARTCATAVKEV